MTKTIRFGAAGIAMFAALGMSSAASAQDATATATAEILEALTLVNDNALDFGTLVVDTAGGSVSIAPTTGAASVCAGSVICSGTSAPAGFTADGQAGATIDINLPASAAELRHVDFATSTAIQHNIPLAFSGSATSLTLDATTGTGTFLVGGTLTLDGSEIPGVYSTQFQVSVNYQ